jgi:PAS domain S-box-containing protein
MKKARLSGSGIPGDAKKKDKSLVLIVDDQPQNLELLEAYLVPQGYEVVTAFNGEEALEKISSQPIDLLLLDVMMPGMDGFEVTRRVRRMSPIRLIPIILVTALRDTDSRVKGIEAGCDDFISKPVDKMELLARVQSLLKVKAYNDLMNHYQSVLESEVSQRIEEINHALVFQQRLIDALPVPVFYKDKDGLYLGCNTSFEDFFGKKRDQVTGQSVYELFPKEFADLYHEKEQALLQNPGIQIYESIAKDAAGVVHNVIFHKATFSNTDGSIGGLIGTFLDITERKGEIERIRKALRETVQAIAVTVETRDPYTAGHQRRVADLARAVAVEMNLPADQIEGIRLAGSIHDIGKISVPAEILSKPTKLTDIEFMLIKTHSQSGYEILKDIEFPWPLAQTVLEHHERMNGSGYPNGVRGDQILLGSRILAVADVVEAMASHRPYRPSLGLDAALIEISLNKGILYDLDVSEACLRLFREKGYQFVD